MRSLFPGHYRLTEHDVAALWDEATIVIDTNSILNLYRYRSEAREDLFSVLESLRERLWIPYQVALEFHRRRVDVIATEKLAFNTAERAVDEAMSTIAKIFESKARNPHSTEVVQSALSEMRVSAEKIKVELNLQRENQLSVGTDDTILTRIEGLLHDKVGSPPTPEAIAEIARAGAMRYQALVPPGFLDAKKGDTYSDRGIQYESKYGDLIIWMQIIEHAKNKKLPAIIFVSDDSKADWWNVKGQHTLGPQPDLVEEIIRVGEVKRFHMYSTDQFLRFANERGRVQVKQESIDQVLQANLSQANSLADLSIAEIAAESKPVSAARGPIIAHALSRHKGYKAEATADPKEFLLKEEVDFLNYRVKFLRFRQFVVPGSTRHIRHEIETLIDRTSTVMEIPELYIVTPQDLASIFLEAVEKFAVPPKILRIFVGFINDDNEFQPVDDDLI